MRQTLAKELGIRIQNQRLAHNYTQIQLAERAGIHPMYLSAVERGARCATLPTLERLTKALNITFSELFAGIEHYQDPTDAVNEVTRLFSSMSPAEQRIAISILHDMIS